MSSKPHHINPVLTRDTYEAYFLLYVDGELTPDEKAAVDAFVLLHPDLKEELEALCSTKLPDETIPFAYKEELLAANMKTNLVDESLLLYIDNELPEWEAKIVEAQLAENEAFTQQHELLLKAKLQPEAISYPHKSSLYRHTERRIAPFWLRIAAAMIVIASGAAVWMATGTVENADPVVAAVEPITKIQQPATDTNLFQNPMPVQEREAVARRVEKKVSEKSFQKPEKNSAVTRSDKMKKVQPTFSKAHAVDESGVASNNLPVARKLESVVNKSIVTSQNAVAYNERSPAGRTMDPVFPVAAVETNEQSGGAKSLLRKATRFIERRTGIKTVNDDNELLVGAVALKL